MILNNKPSRISQEKKELVKQIAKQLNYTPNQIAQSLSLQKTNTIGLIVPDLANPFFATLSKEIELRLRQAEYFTFIVNSDEINSYEQMLVEKMQQRQVDGLLVCLSNDNYFAINETAQWIQALQIPIVLVDRPLNQDNIAPLVSFNHFQGGQLVGEYIQKRLSQTRQKVACLTAGIHTHITKERLAGFKDKLDNHPMTVISGDYTIESGYQMAAELFETVDPNELAGVFCFNDLIAYGVIQYTTQHQIDWQSLGIVGYDNLEIGRVFGYHFPSVSQDIPQLAKEACQLLLSHLENDGAMENIILEVELQDGK